MIFIKSLTTSLSRLFFVIFLLVGWITACTTTSTIDISTTTVSFTPTFTDPPPTSTPTPVQEKVVFLESADSPNSISQSISSTLLELTQAQGWGLISSNDRSLDEFDAGTRLIVVLPPDPGLETLSRQYPAIQFIAIGISNLQPSSNLSIVGAEGFREDRVAFVAGYISAVLTKDWRIGLVNQASSEWRDPIHQSFINGIAYYCGICQLAYPPFYDYPILTELANEASQAEWENAANNLLSKAVRTVFIYSNEANLRTMEYLSQNGIALHGIRSPLDELESSWIATIRLAPEEIIRLHWDDLVNHRGGWVEEIPMILEDVNEGLFSIGKQRWVQEVIDDLVDGYIDTGSDY